MQTIRIEPAVHKEEQRIKLLFGYDKELISLVRKIPGSAWSRTMKCWHIPADDFQISEITKHLEDKAIIDDSALILKPETVSDAGFSHTKENSSKQDNTLFKVSEICIHCNEKEKTLYLKLPFKLKESFKKLEGAWWHPKIKQWSALDTSENRDQLNEILLKDNLQPVYQTDTSQPVKKVRTPKLNSPVLPDENLYRYFTLENKAKSTIKQYTWYITWFLTHNRDAELTRNPGELVQDFLYKQVIGCGYGKTAQNIAHSALQNYYRIIHNIDLHTENIPRAKQKRSLPKVLSAEEFKKIYRNCNNPKHKIILKLMYGCGLRREEVCELKTEDVDIPREILFIKGKGSKIRVLNPGKRLLEDMKEYIESYKPGEYFIEGQRGEKYSGTSIEKIVKRTAEKAGIKRNVTPHMFRHTFATHHVERGTELRLIQEALGHSSSKTTEIYTHVSRTNIKKMPNLLDDLDL
jgi:integrase/recombinase XerD